MTDLVLIYRLLNRWIYMHHLLIKVGVIPYENLRIVSH